MWGLIQTEIKSFSALLKWPKIGRHLGPLPRSFFSKSPNQNSEIAILFSIVEKPTKYVFGDDLLPTVSVEGAASYKLWPVFTHSNGY